MINCKIVLDFSWSKYWVKSEVSRTFWAVGNPPVQQMLHKQLDIVMNTHFQINNVKTCVPVVTLSINDTKIFLDNIKSGFTRTIYWNNYRSELTTQTKINNLDYLIDETFSKTNRLFVLLFKMVIMILQEIHLKDITCIQ